MHENEKEMWKVLLTINFFNSLSFPLRHLRAFEKFSHLIRNRLISKFKTTFTSYSLLPISFARELKKKNFHIFASSWIKRYELLQLCELGLAKLFMMVILILRH